MPYLTLDAHMWQLLKVNSPEMSGPGKIWEKEMGVGHSKPFLEAMREGRSEYQIEIKQETYNRLKEAGNPGKTPNDTLRRILKVLEPNIPPPPSINETFDSLGWPRPKNTGTIDGQGRITLDKKKAPTVIDTFYRSSFNKEAGGGWTSNAKWREAFINARRFILDDEMSTFLGELGTHVFAQPSMKLAAAARAAEHLRLSARLPFETTWIEYNLRNAMKRSHELLGAPLDPSKSPQHEGWLLQQHPTIPTACRVHILSHDDGHTDEHGFNAWTFPVAFAWTVDDETVIPWREVPFDDKGARPSEVATGISGYVTDRASIVFSDMVHTPRDAEAVAGLVKEWSGVMRRVWALLATINDLPVRVTEVRPSRGFVAKGNFRKFLQHKTITLTVPQNRYRKVIKQALALARRRAHGVRGHWRKDWHHPLSPLCEHDFTADERHMTCKHCHGRKSWVTPHQRGDASIGLVTHDYQVKHDE